jgi:hypothetical protein
MSDIYRLIEKLNMIAEGTVTPTGVKGNLNAQQKSVNQMPALFKPKHISVINNPTDPEHPAKDYFVGEYADQDLDEASWERVISGIAAGLGLGGEPAPVDAPQEPIPQVQQQKQDSTKDNVRRAYDLSRIIYSARELSSAGAKEEAMQELKNILYQMRGDPQQSRVLDIIKKQKEQSQIQETAPNDSGVESAILRRIMNQHLDLLGKYGPERVMAAARDEAEWRGDVEEIGTSDVSAYVQAVVRRLQDGEYDHLRESQQTEDVVSTVKKKLGDYLSDLSKEIKADPDLKDKLPQEIDQVGPAVKTITTDDGHEIKIHGNEDDGFRITIKNKPSKSKFESLEHAVIACEMYCSRRRGTTQLNTNTDYLDEQ